MVTVNMNINANFSMLFNLQFATCFALESKTAKDKNNK
jgi:hypothetical protein